MTLKKCCTKEKKNGKKKSKEKKNFYCVNYQFQRQWNINVQRFINLYP